MCILSTFEIANLKVNLQIKTIHRFWVLCLEKQRGVLLKTEPARRGPGDAHWVNRPGSSSPLPL